LTELSDTALLELIHQGTDSPALRVLFERYRPVLYRMQRRYFIPGHDDDDWEQEALLVFCTVIENFKFSRSLSFGAFYRLNLAHRVYDLIRKSHALKRQAGQSPLSLEEHGAYFADTLVDEHWIVREQLEVKETLLQLQGELSAIERVVFTGLVQGNSLGAISQQQTLPLKQVISAAHRSQIKLRRLLAE